MIAVLTQPEGLVTVTDGVDKNHEIPSFPELQKRVAEMTDDLTGAVAGVKETASYITSLVVDAQRSATDSATSAAASEASAVRSDTSAAASDQSAIASAASATSSEASKQASEASAVASADTAAQSAESAATSATSATLSGNEADDSAASASTALLAAGDALASRNLSQAWAVNGEDVPVQAGEFSAKHWAKKAQSFATGSLVYLGAWDASSGELPAGAKKGAFYKIIGTGTVDGITYRNGDNIVHNGVDWDLIDNTETVTAVAGKVGNVTLVPADIVGLQALLDGKAGANHSHAIADVVGLQSALDGKQASLGYTPINQADAKATNSLTINQGVSTPALNLMSSSGNKGYRLGGSVDTANDYGMRFDHFNGTSWVNMMTLVEGQLTVNTGVVSIGYALDSGGGTNGTAAVQRGNTTNSGFIEFRMKDGTRAAYLGYASSVNKRVEFTTENGYSWYFSNALSTAGEIVVGGTVYFNTFCSSTNNAAVLSTSVPGIVYLRPNGAGNSTGEATVRNNGDLYVNAWVYAANFKLTSDLRLKSSVRKLSAREELDNIRKLVPLFYEKNGHKEYGFGAQDVERVYPTTVSAGDGAAGSDTRSLSLTELIAPLVAAVQALDDRLTGAGL